MVNGSCYYIYYYLQPVITKVARQQSGLSDHPCSVALDKAKCPVKG